MSGHDGRSLLYASLLELGANRSRRRYRSGSALAGSSFVSPHPGPLLRLAGGAEPPKEARRVLGISAFYHDSAAALVIDGVPVAAAHEERFTRRKHDAALPREAAAFCLRQAGLRLAEIDLIAFYEDPLLKLDRMAEAVQGAQPPLESLETLGFWKSVQRNFALQQGLAEALGGDGTERVCFVQHHLSHAASAFYPSPFRQAACLTLDGVGEWATAVLAIGDGEELRFLEQIDYPHSLGLLYSALTAYLGFAANSDEYKVMALAAFGRPSFRRRLEELFQIFGDGSFALALNPLAVSSAWQSPDEEKLQSLLGIPPRPPGAALNQEHFDLARSLQEMTEEAMLGLLGRLHRQTGLDQLVMAGGVTLNGVANYKAFQASPFREVFIQPAAGDAGGALGAALYAFYQGGRAKPGRQPPQAFDPFLGPAFSQEEVERAFDREQVLYRTLEWDELLEVVAQALARDRVVGWFQERMELGPRALGGRSILASPLHPSMQETVNRKVKFREGFRPFAPVLPIEEAPRFFGLSERLPPLDHMLFVLPVAEEQRAAIPAVLHIDGTTRPQLVCRDRHPRIYGLLRAFEAQTGVPVLLNTSFNLAGEPIVCTPYDAYKTFLYSDIDLLVVERCLVVKEGRG